MTTIVARHTTPAKRTKPVTAASENPKAARRPSSGRSVPSKTEPVAEQNTARVSKHDRVLELLSQRNGATILELMAATGWQQHSVRGFLAGTVKKKLGFALTSSRAEGELRRYRIDSKGGR